MRVHVGTSGWRYDHWREDFYAGSAPKHWLRHYASHFDTVEVRSSFERLPSTRTIRTWVSTTPPDFTFAVKATRFLTHVMRLKQPEDAVRRFVDALAPLGARLGPVLLQLPPDLPYAPERVADAVAAFPPGWRVALEPRHPSWSTPALPAMLAQLGATPVVSDWRGTVVEWPSTVWSYVRLHEGRGQPVGCYDDEDLLRWARWARSHAAAGDVFIYFTNDRHGCAVHNAERLLGLLQATDLHSVPTP